MDALKFRNNDTMPIIGLGTWKSQPNQVYQAVKEALKIGYRHIDCAAIYGNEKEVGQALKEAVAEGIVGRKELWITSKLWNNAHKKEHVEKALKNTLTDLGLEYLDLYLIHWPVVLKPEVVYPSKGEDFISLEETPLIETWEGMGACLENGLARHIGVSNFSRKKIQTLMAESGPAPEINQVELHPFLQQNRLVDFCQTNHILLTAYAPLGSGDRPAALKAENEPSLLENPVVVELAERKNCSPAQILISWSVEREIAVIPKSVNPARLSENLAAHSISLSEDEMALLASLDRHQRYIRGNFWTIPGSPYTTDNLWDE